MNVKLKAVIVFLMIVVLFICNSCQKKTTSYITQTYNLSVKKVGNVWKVVNSGNTTDTIVVHRNDKIYWDVDSTDAYFQFPVEDKKIFNITAPGSNHLKDGYTTVIKAGGRLKLQIKDDPQKGPIVYAVFCIADSVFAIQNSPPVVVVE